jgi:chaperonin GroEL
MAKELIFNDDARQKIKDGVETLSKAVGVTMGPCGRNVIIDRGGRAIMTKDGVTVARNIVLDDNFENLGASAVKEVASKTAAEAGDGTTTATILADGIYKEGLKSVTAGGNPTVIKQGIDMAVKAITKELKDISQPVETKEQIKQVATISANGDEEIGDIIAEAMERVGSEGTITVEESRALETSLNVVEGMQFDRGFLSPYFINKPETREAVLDNALVLITSEKIASVQDIAPILQHSTLQKRPLLIIADEIESEVMATLVLNKMNGALKICAVKCPGFGQRRLQILGDIAAVTDATVVTADTGQTFGDEFSLDWLGGAKKISVSKSSTLIINGAGDKEDIDERANEIRNDIERSSDAFEIDNYKTRLAKLVGGVGVISVGAPSELEMKEKRDRVEDALCATRAASEEGVVDGGGTALIKALIKCEKELKASGDMGIGIDIIKKAVLKPLRQIVENADGKPDVVIQKILSSKGERGYDAKNDKYVNMIEAGIIDPTKVTRTALQYAASVASMLLTTECIITDAPTDDHTPQMPPGMGMPGMGMPGMM